MPESVRTPAPFLVSVPAPPRRPAMVAAAALFAVREVARSSPVVLVIVPAEKVTAPAALLNAPRESAPVPLIAMAPGRASVAPMTKVPADRVVPPVKVFAPVSVTEPAVDLLSAPEPRMAEIVPLVSVSCEAEIVPPASVPLVSVTAFVSVLPLRSSVPVPLIVMTAEPKAALSPAWSVPAETEVAPLKLAFARVTASVPVPLIESAPEPAIKASREIVPVAAEVRVVAVRIPVVPVILPEVKVMAPEVLLNDASESVPPLTVTAPGSALATPRARVPAVTVVPPVKVFALVRVRVPPAPFIVRVVPAPRMASSETAVVAFAVKDVPESTPVPPVMLPEA